MSSEEYTTKYWENISVGQTVILTDNQSLEDNGGKPLQFLIKEIRNVYSKDAGTGWRMVYLTNGDKQPLWLLIKMVGELMELRLYYEPCAIGNRKDAIENGKYWLFQQPKDESSFQYNELLYTYELHLRNLECNDALDIYTQKPVGLLQAQVIEIYPERPSFKGAVVFVQEYKLNSDFNGVNNEAIIFETGGSTSDDGGLIQILVGCIITPEDIEVL